MGGVKTDLHGKSNVHGLYAAGEAACTGVHGANRLASNSLLEGMVFGARAGQAMREEPGAAPSKTSGCHESAALEAITEETEPLICEIQQLMWNKVGIVRIGTGLKEAQQQLQSMTERLPQPVSRRTCEARNLHAAALLIVRSALARLESRGAHYRLDYPEHNDVRFKRHSVITEKGVRFE